MKNYKVVGFPDVKKLKIKGVLIDIDDTLYSYKNTHEIALKECYKAFKAQVDSTITLEVFGRLYREKRDEVTSSLYPQGSCRSRLLAFQRLFESINIMFAYKKALEFDTIYWDSFLNHMSLLNEAKNFLLQCQKNQVLVCAVTDMLATIQIRKLEMLKLDGLIHYLVTSEETGKEKPASEMFELALNKLSLTEQDVIMIGDNQSKDIEGAKRLGIQSYKISLNHKI